MKHPLLRVDLGQMSKNYNAIYAACGKLGVSFTTVVKGVNSYPDIINMLYGKGVRSFASSRLNQIVSIRETLSARADDCDLMLIRIPMLSEVDELVKFANSCLISEFKTIEAIDSVCGADPNLTHPFDIILMVEIGDLREGIFGLDNILDLTKKVKELKHINLKGIGTNLGCYGGVRSTREKMQELVDIAQTVEKVNDLSLDIISGGGTNTLPLVWQNDLPPRLNHLRLGEGILYGFELGKEHGIPFAGYERGTMILEAEVVEVQDKPTHPMGEILEDAFRNIPTYEDIGMQRKLVLAVGRLDYGFIETIIPVDKSLSLLGASSDHTLVIDGNKQYKLGDIVSFEVCYAAGATLMTGSICKEIRRAGS